MNILEKIALDKQKEVQRKKLVMPIRVLERLPLFNRSGYSMKENLLGAGSGIIAEFKRKSPSIPELNLKADVERIPVDYETAGAVGISILTDEIYFGGTLDDLMKVRETVELPILRKDFIIDEFQIFESKAFGADVILLIAALLSRKQIQLFSQISKKLGLEVLLEVHNEEELQNSIMPGIDMIGVNNRNLRTFEVDLNTSKELSTLIPEEFVKISESGISRVSSIRELREYGFKGFLMGENFMKTEDPGNSAKRFIEELISK